MIKSLIVFLVFISSVNLDICKDVSIDRFGYINLFIGEKKNRVEQIIKSKYSSKGITLIKQSGNIYFLTINTKNKKINMIGFSENNVLNNISVKEYVKLNDDIVFKTIKKLSDKFGNKPEEGIFALDDDETLYSWKKGENNFSIVFFNDHYEMFFWK